jgi:putative transposase
MLRAGLAGRCPRRWRKTTVADANAEARAVDLIKRIFGPDTKLDTRWVGHITYIATWEGWAYLATVIDLASRRVVGWALADHMRTDLVADALRMACAHRRPAAGVIFHSDRGCHYTSRDFAALAGELGVTLSVGRKGEGWDNAVSESWFATFKNELIYTRSWPTLPACARRCSSTSRAGTTPAGSTAAWATSAPPSTKRPSTRRPPLERHDQHTNPVRQTGLGPN